MMKAMSLRKISLLVVIALCLSGFVRIAQAATANRLILYINNSGMSLLIGKGDNKKPDKVLSVDQSTDPSLTHDPSTLVFTTSPLKVFNTLLDKYAPEIRASLGESLPVEFSIIAAGTEVALTNKCPPLKAVADYLTDLDSEQIEECLQAENKLEFFKRVFYAKIKNLLSEHSVIMGKISQDDNLIVKMAVSHYHQKKTLTHEENEQIPDQSSETKNSNHHKKALLVVNATTTMPLYLVWGNPNNYFNLQKYINNIYAVGYGFSEAHAKEFVNSECMQSLITETGQWTELDQDKFEACLQKFKDPLLSAIYLNKKDTFPQMPYLVCRLAISNRGYNMFGDWVKEVLSITEDGRVCEQAIALIDKVSQSLLTCITSVILNFYNDDADTDAQLDIIFSGDRSDLLQEYALKKGDTSIAQRLAAMLQDPHTVESLFYKLQAQTVSREAFTKTIQEKAIPALKKMTIVPQNEFFPLMYRTVLQS